MSDAHVDYETFSTIDLTRVGAFRYARHLSTEILIACWAIGDSPVRRWTPWDGIIKCDDIRELFDAITRGDKLFAHNAQFEYALTKYVGTLRYGFPDAPPEQWHCTAARAAMCSLPRSLEGSSRAMEVDARKDPRGKALMRIFSIPPKPDKNGEQPPRILPTDSPDEFIEYIGYCADDVVTERELDHVLPAMPDALQNLYTRDLQINERGFRVDVPLIHKAIHVTSHLEAEIKKEVRVLTGGISQTQVAKLLSFLQLDGDLDIDNLQAETLRRVVKNAGITITDNVRRIIELRLEGSRASTKKLRTMIDCADPEDQRVRGAFLFHGAHTGRWTGRLVQPHNFIRGLLKLHEQETVFELLNYSDPSLFHLLYDAPMSAIAQCMRGFIVPLPGNRFLVADYSAIEARLTFWFAGDDEALDLYRKGDDLYKHMAVALFGVAYEDVTDEQRRISKNLVLGCGFGLGWKKFIVYCDKQGVFIDGAFSKLAVGTYRGRFLKVPKLWRAVNNAAIEAFKTKSVTKVQRVNFDGRDPKFFRIWLPSKRPLYYPYPELRTSTKKYLNEETGEETERVETNLTYVEEFQGRFIRVSTYGGKLTENIVQGMAADVLAHGMENVEAHGYPLSLHVHDELVNETPIGTGSAEEFARLASEDLPSWLAGCPIEAKGFECTKYRKE